MMKIQIKKSQIEMYHTIKHYSLFIPNNITYYKDIITLTSPLVNYEKKNHLQFISQLQYKHSQKDLSTDIYDNTTNILDFNIRYLIELENSDHITIPLKIIKNTANEIIFIGTLDNFQINGTISLLLN